MGHQARIKRCFMAKMFFSTSEVADLFNVNRVTIYRWVKEGMVKG
ncbi:MAG: helix-turn-helix domain-containing protein, partial [Syntrophobacterales bacterium]|nr:helix-turn-helix domain-containing protein [Syntrophobacterales bacterium]